MVESNKVRTALDESDLKGAFVRKDSIYRDIISKNSDTFKPESNRYHLYVAYACPWASRTLILRALKGLEDCISVSIVHPTWQKTKPLDENDTHVGWTF
jgi:putative glutathione S-transferase